jgi:hypothetical protein
MRILSLFGDEHIARAPRSPAPGEILWNSVGKPTKGAGTAC